MNKLTIQGVILQKGELKNGTSQSGNVWNRIELVLHYSNKYENFQPKFIFWNQAAINANNLAVGSEVVIEGRVATRIWEGKHYIDLQGKNIVLANEVVPNNNQVVNNHTAQDQTVNNQVASSHPLIPSATVADTLATAPDNDYDDDIPF
jgi:single-stranded DNA-binding protein